MSESTLQSNRVRVTLLDGSTFVVCDERGDVDGVSAASGFFAADTRFLSRSVLTIDGDRGEPVGFEQSAPHVGVFELEWETGLAVRRELFVGRGLEEEATVWNRSDREVEVVVELDLASDFADIFAVKRVEDLGAPGVSEVAPSRPEHWQDARTVEFADEGFPARTLVHLAPAPDETDGGTARYRVATCVRRALATRRCGAVAAERNTGARRCRVRGGAARRSSRAGRVAGCVVELGAAAAGARRTEPGSGLGAVAH